MAEEEKKKKKSLVWGAAGAVISLPGRIWKLIKFGITITVIIALVIGYSGYQTVQGFRDDSVQQSEELFVDTVNNTANFTLTIENKGFLPIKIDMDLRLDVELTLSDVGGRQVSVFYKTSTDFNVKGGESQTRNIVFKGFLDEDIKAIKDGAIVTYTPTVKASYAWIVPIKNTELDEQELIINKMNHKPEIHGVEISPDPVFTGTLTQITTNVTNVEDENLTYAYTMNGNLLSVDPNATSFNWSAPDVPGVNILGVEVKDEKNTVKETFNITVQKPLFLTLNSSVDHDANEATVWVNASKTLGADPEAYFHKQGEAKSALALTEVGTGNVAWTGSFSVSDGTYFMEAMAADPADATRVVKEHSELKIESVTTVANKAQVTTSNVTIDITTTEPVTDVPFSVSEFTENPILGDEVEGEPMYGIKKFLRIEAPADLKLDYALVTINYEDEDLPARTDEENIALYYWNEDTMEWEAVDIVSRDTENNSFVANLTHFSIYGGFSSNRAPFVNAGDDIGALVDEDVIFSAFYEDDLGDQAVLFEWDFDGDGVYDYTSTTSVKANHSYSEAGTYTVTVRITDSGDAQGYDTIFVTVEEEDLGALKGALAEMPGFELPGMMLGFMLVALVAFYRRNEEH